MQPLPSTPLPQSVIQGQHTGAGGGAAATLIAVILVALVTGNAFRRAIAEEQSHLILLARVIEDQVPRARWILAKWRWMLWQYRQCCALMFLMLRPYRRR